jgi:hypothetical protein
MSSRATTGTPTCRGTSTSTSAATWSRVVLVQEEDVDGVGRQRDQRQRGGEDGRLVRPAGDGRRPEGEDEEQHEDTDDVELGVLVDDVPCGLESAAGQRRHPGNDQQVEDGAADDGTDAEGELVVAKRADDDGAQLREAGADRHHDRAVDGGRQPVVTTELLGGALEPVAAGPGDRRRDDRQS